MAAVLQLGGRKHLASGRLNPPLAKKRSRYFPALERAVWIMRLMALT